MRAPRRRSERALVASLAFAGMSAAFMQTILTPLQGELPDLLNAPREDTAWVITITLLVSAVFTPISGRLGDQYGKRRLALVVLGALVLGSVVCSVSATIVPLMIGRALQGVGMGVIPLGISVLRDVLPEQRLTRAVALVSATLGVGGALGLPVSALVSDVADWHVLFVLAAVLGAAALVGVFLFVPDSLVPAGAGRFDLLGAIGLAISVAALLVFVARCAVWGWLSWPSVSLLAVGLAVFVPWVIYERRRSDPLIDIVTSSRKPVLLTNITSIALGFGFFSSSVVFPQRLTLDSDLGGDGLTLLQASLILVPSGIVMLIVSQFAGWVDRHVGARLMLSSGALVIAAGYGAVLIAPAGWGSVLAANAMIGVGLGLGFAAMPILIMRHVPAGETAAANGLNTLMRSLGTSLAAAAVAAVLAQQSTVVGGHTIPTADGFRTAILIAAGASVIAAVLAVFIPSERRRRGVPTAGDEHP